VRHSIVGLAAETHSTPLPIVDDKDVALLRENLQEEAKKLITNNMQLTYGEAAHSTCRWPPNC
jgi:hypothetical protein